MSEPAVPNLVVGPAPHIKATDDVPEIMRAVAVALVPAFLFSLYRFGYWSWVVTLLAVAAAVGTEAAIQRFRGVRVTVNDWSAAVTGLLLAATLPPNVAWYVPVAGSVIAIGIAKQCFGGLGCNIWNPALIGRAFLQIAFPAQISMSSWPWVTHPLADVRAPATTPSELQSGASAIHHAATAAADAAASAAKTAVDVFTSATPLQRLDQVTEGPDGMRMRVVGHTLDISWNEVLDAFLGNVNGSIAEVSALALILGGLYLLMRNIISWHIPAGYIGTVALLGWALPMPVHVHGSTFYTQWFTGPALFHVMAGGVMIGALFMATDMVTSPMSRAGKLVFGIGCGLITILIRLYSGAYPEGVCYSILLMNTMVPMIDGFTRPRVFGKKTATGK